MDVRTSRNRDAGSACAVVRPFLVLIDELGLALEEVQVMAATYFTTFNRVC